jgi:hypothetical protein
VLLEGLGKVIKFTDLIKFTDCPVTYIIGRKQILTFGRTGKFLQKDASIDTLSLSVSVLYSFSLTMFSQLPRSCSCGWNMLVWTVLTSCGCISVFPICLPTACIGDCLLNTLQNTTYIRYPAAFLFLICTSGMLQAIGGVADGARTAPLSEARRRVW